MSVSASDKPQKDSIDLESEGAKSVGPTHCDGHPRGKQYTVATETAAPCPKNSMTTQPKARTSKIPQASGAERCFNSFVDVATDILDLRRGLRKLDSTLKHSSIGCLRLWLHCKRDLSVNTASWRVTSSSERASASIPQLVPCHLPKRPAGLDLREGEADKLHGRRRDRWLDRLAAECKDFLDMSFQPPVKPISDSHACSQPLRGEDE